MLDYASKLNNNFKKNTFFFIFVLAIILPFFMALWFTVTGVFPFWYDNSRDLLSAWRNLSDPTLIGPTTGIPGLFYGPYWIWMLSIPLFFTKDPRATVIAVGILPYFILFPIVLMKFRSIFSRVSIIVAWIFFIFNIGEGYATNLWNPHVAPLLLLVLILTIVFFDFKKFNLKSVIKMMFAGIISGLIVNFHVSLGIGVSIGLALYYLAYFILHRKDFTILNYVKYLSVFYLSFLVTFLPFLLFEVRNNFLQSKVLISAVLELGNVVNTSGLSKDLILKLFIGRAGDLTGLHESVGFMLVGIFAGLTVFLWLRKIISFTKNEKNLLLTLFSISIGILTLYLSAKNPVWSYHFLGVEILFLLLFGLIITKIRTLLYISVIFAGVLVIAKTYDFYDKANNNFNFEDSLATKESVVKTVVNDSEKASYSFYAYSPSIYMYEYSYLFKWFGDKEVHFDPGVEQKNDGTVYLVIPSYQSAEVLDFINFRASPEMYNIKDKWVINDDIIIMKYTKNEK